MNRWLLLVALAWMLALTGTGHGGPVTPWQPKRDTIAPLVSYMIRQEFKGGERACAIASGGADSYLGLYVYDSYGNCIAWDDTGTTATFDDVAAEWFPMQTGVFVVEVRNCGYQANHDCKIVLR